MTLRDYQIRAVDDVRNAYSAGHRRVVYVGPTGSGKTVVGAEVVSRAVSRGRRVLWLAHRRELVEQTAKRIPGAGVVMAGVAPADAPVQVASLDTLVARGERPPADMVVIDECHHATAETWRDLLDSYPRAWVLGLTATPERADGVALGNVFEALVPGPSVPDLVAAGHLVDCEVLAPDSERNALACEPWEAWSKWCRRGDSGFVFARTIEQSKRIASELNARGIPARHVDGETNTIARTDAIESFRLGFVNVLCSVFVFTEGVDLPRARVCMLARGCGATGTYLQMVGRVLRPHPLKDKALLIDLVGAVHAHGLPTDARTYSLDGRAISTNEKVPPLSQCTECGAVWRSGSTRCPRCGYVLPPPEEPRVVLAKIDEVRKVLRPHASLKEKRERMVHLRKVAAEKGYKVAWAAVRFKAIYGHWPRGL